MTIPSKELLNVMLGTDDINTITLNNNEIRIHAMTNHKKEEVRINIYILTHLMKEWADKTEYYFTIFLGGNIDIDINKKYIKGMRTVKVNSVSGNTEFEAVTKACEWILNQQKDK